MNCNTGGSGGNGGFGNNGGNEGIGNQQNLNDPDDGVCFHGSGVVVLADGRRKLMRDVEIGDSVHVGGGKYSEVFMFTHRDAGTDAVYVEITVASGDKVMVTASHFMYAAKGVVQAGSIEMGDGMEMDDGRVEIVVKRELVSGKGLYNPQTVHGDVAVSGFRASTYTTFVQTGVAHSLLAPLRAMYRICGAHISAVF